MSDLELTIRRYLLPCLGILLAVGIVLTIVLNLAGVSDQAQGWTLFIVLFGLMIPMLVVVALGARKVGRERDGSA